MELRSFEGLCYVIRGAEFDRLYDLVGIVHAREHHHFLLRPNLLAALKHLKTVHARHRQIEQYQTGSRTTIDPLQRFLTCSGGLYFVIVHFQYSLGVTKHAWLVIDEQDSRRGHL